MNSSINLVHQSCFDFLPTIEDKSIDLVLIDPPYEISRDTNFANGNGRIKISMDFGEWDKGFTGLDIVMKECYRVLKEHGTIICFYDLWKITTLKDYMEQAGFKQLRFIEWIKTNPVPVNSMTNYLTTSREIAVTAVKGSKPTFNSKYDNGIYSYSICQDADRFHPTQKPVVLVEELIKKHSNPNELVLDCFSGSGTTAVASYNTGRRFIGCELSDEYYPKAMARIEKATNSLFG